MKILNKLLLLVFVSVIASCDSNDSSDDQIGGCNEPATLLISFKFDPNQERLNNLGQPSTVPEGNAAQSPNITRMSANYIELAPDANTPLGQGEIIYQGSETNAGENLAIDFQDAQFAGNNELFLSIPLSNVSPGTYRWVRISLAYQEGTIDLLVNGNELTGTLGSFVGYNNYITSFNLNGNTIDVNDDKAQGFWVFETSGFTTQGQAPEGATTVPNPLFDTSPIPQGSCVVTGRLDTDLVIPDQALFDEIHSITLSFSVNNSFEWIEVNEDGKYEPGAGEQVIDMGLRGLKPSYGFGVIDCF